MRVKMGKNILLADDSEFFRIKVSQILKGAGHRVEFAGNGEEVIERLEEGAERFDLLILDLQMPEVDGFGVLRWMKQHGLTQRLPVLVITGAYESSEVIEEVRDLGAAGYITKGVSPSHLLYRVNKALYGGIDFGRKSTRVPTNFPVDYTCNGVTRTGFVLNISETGAFIYTGETLQPGDMVSLRFSLPGTRKIIEAEGKVIWVNRVSGEEAVLNGMGIHFTTISPDDRAAIASFIEGEEERLNR